MSFVVSIRRQGATKMRLFGIYISFLVFLALNLVTGSSNSENRTKANLFQENLEIPCIKPYRLPFRQLEWCTCPAIENCTSCFHRNLIAYIKDNTTVLVDFQGKYELDSRGTLKIPKVLPKLDGIGYLCRVEYYLIGWRGKVRVLEIAKESPKIVSQGPRTVCVVEGMKLVLECEAVGFPIPNIKWTINDELLQNHTGTECSYVKEKSTKNDKGLYICQAENSLGSYNRTVEVLVLDIQMCWSSHSDILSTSRPRPSDTPSTSCPRPSGDFPSSHGPSPSSPPSDTLSTSRPHPSGYFPSSHGPSPSAPSPSGEGCKQEDFGTAMKNPKVLALVVTPWLLCAFLVSILIRIMCCTNQREQCCCGDALWKNYNRARSDGNRQTRPSFYLAPALDAKGGASDLN